jgi:drug/metabolite transporter (DMT)-like permease
MFLGEALTPTMAIAGAIILGSVIFSQKRKA